MGVALSLRDTMEKPCSFWWWKNTLRKLENSDQVVDVMTITLTLYY